MDKGEVLKFKLHHQELPYWCWVAVGGSIIHYYDKRDINQCDLATQELKISIDLGVSKSCCPPIKDSPCDQPWSVGDVLKHYSLFRDLITKPASFDQIKAEIDQKRPMVVRLEWQEGMKHNPAHFILLCGYVQKDGNNYVIIKDPGHDRSEEDDQESGHQYIYDDLFAHYIGTTETKWTHTYFTEPNPNKQPHPGEVIDKITRPPKKPQDLSKSEEQVRLWAATIAEMASNGSKDYQETQETAQDIVTKINLEDGGVSLNNAKNAGSLAYSAARELKQTSRSLYRVLLLYAKVLDSQDQEEVNIYLQQVSKERTRIELAMQEIRKYKNEINLLKKD